MFIFFFTLFISKTYSQFSLENDKRNALEGIELTNELLNKTQDAKVVTIEKYLALKAQLRSRNSLIHTLDKELVFLSDSISNIVEQIEHQETILNEQKGKYAEMIRTLYHEKLTGSTVQFLLSSSDLNEAFERVNFIKQFESYRKKQVLFIKKHTDKLIEIRNGYQDQLAEKKKLITSSKEQVSLLQRGSNMLSEFYDQLISREGGLEEQLKEKKIANDNFAAELDKTFTDSRLNNVVDRKNKISNFQTRKGKYDWPTQEGVVVQYFGEQAHPTLKNIKIKNNGIDILTRKNSSVSCIHEGKVVGVSEVPGYGNTIIIKHRNYYTVYARLKDVVVKKGDFVKKRTVLGLVNSPKSTDSPILHFEVWYKKKPLNPIEWIQKRIKK